MKTEIAPDIWVIGFPKSGNTWISYLSSYCFNLPFGNYGNPKGNPKKQWVQDLTSGKNAWLPLAGFRSVQKTHRYPDHVPVGNGLVIYAIRDPRDVFVSYHYFMQSRNARLPGRIRYYLLGLLGRRMQIQWFIGKWKQHLDVWLDRSDLVLSYDRLLAEGHTYLSSAFARPPFQVDAYIAEQAYEQFSFKNMSGGRKAGTEESGSFFRKGVSGDWKNHFSTAEAGLFNEALEAHQRAVS